MSIVSAESCDMTAIIFVIHPSIAITPFIVKIGNKAQQFAPCPMLCQ
jgi:hypothetical protein